MPIKAIARFLCSTLLAAVSVVSVRPATPTFQDIVGTNGITNRVVGSGGNQKVMISGERLQPGSENLTNWSLLSTSILSSISATGGVTAFAQLYNPNTASYGVNSNLVVFPTFTVGYAVNAWTNSQSITTAVDGYYQVNAGLSFAADSGTFITNSTIGVYTNGVIDGRFRVQMNSPNGGVASVQIDGLAYYPSNTVLSLGYLHSSGLMPAFSLYGARLGVLLGGGASSSSGGGGATNAVTSIMTNGVYVISTGATNINFIGATGMVSGGTAIIGGFSGGSSGDATNILSGRTVFVDKLNGNDTTATRTNFAKPAATIARANQLSLYGDTIVIRNGPYDELDMVTNGRNYILQDAVVRYTGALGRAVVNDFYGATTNTISGSGTIWHEGSVSGTAVAISNTLSVVNISGIRLLGVSGGGTQMIGAAIKNGKVRIVSPLIEGSNLGATDDTCYGLVIMGGDVIVNTTEVTGEKSGVWIKDLTENDRVIVNGQYATAYWEAPILMGSSTSSETNTTDAQATVHFDHVIGRGNPLGGIAVYNGHLTFSSLWLGQTNGLDTVPTHGESPIVMRGGRLTMRSEFVAGHFGLISIDGGLFDISVGRFYDLASTVYPGGIWVTNAQGTIRDFSVLKTNGPVLHYGGTNLTIANAYLAVQNSAASNHVVRAEANGLVLKDVTINAPAAAPSISASSARTVTVEGFTKMSKTNHPNVSLAGVAEVAGGLYSTLAHGFTQSGSFTNGQIAQFQFGIFDQHVNMMDSADVLGNFTNGTLGVFQGPILAQSYVRVSGSGGLSVANGITNDTGFTDLAFLTVREPTTLQDSLQVSGTATMDGPVVLNNSLINTIAQAPGTTTIVVDGSLNSRTSVLTGNITLLFSNMNVGQKVTWQGFSSNGAWNVSVPQSHTSNRFDRFIQQPRTNTWVTIQAERIASGWTNFNSKANGYILTASGTAALSTNEALGTIDIVGSGSGSTNVAVHASGYYLAGGIRLTNNITVGDGSFIITSGGSAGLVFDDAGGSVDPTGAGVGLGNSTPFGSLRVEEIRNQGAIHTANQIITNKLRVLPTVVIASTTNTFLDMSSGNNFHVYMLTNTTLVFTNQEAGIFAGTVKVQQDTNGNRVVNLVRVAGGILQTNGYWEIDTNASALVKWDFESGIFSTNIVLTTVNLPVYGTNDFVLNQYYTNENRMSWVSAVSSESNQAAIGLWLDQNADGTFEKTGISLTNGQLSAYISPGGRFLFTNAAGASIAPNSSQYIKQ